MPDADPETHPRSPPTLSLLFRQHREDVGRWAIRLGGPGIDVDDVVQEVFVVVARQLAGFRGDAKVTTWLFRITDRVVSNHRRWWRVRRILTSLGGRDDEDGLASTPDPGRSLEEREMVRLAFAVLDELPTRDRKVLVLAELEGLPAEEIAVLLDAKLETVRVWLHRARKRWESQLQQRQQGGTGS